MQSYDLTLAAEEDLRGTWRYTFETWGFDQAEKYFGRIKACCEAIGNRRARTKGSFYKSYPWASDGGCEASPG